MGAYCWEQTGMALADFRARYLTEAQQPRQASGLAQQWSPPSAPCAPCVPVSGVGRVRPARPENRPVGAGFAPVWGVRF